MPEKAGPSSGEMEEWAKKEKLFEDIAVPSGFEKDVKKYEKAKKKAERAEARMAEEEIMPLTEEDRAIEAALAEGGRYSPEEMAQLRREIKEKYEELPEFEVGSEPPVEKPSKWETFDLGPEYKPSYWSGGRKFAKGLAVAPLLFIGGFLWLAYKAIKGTVWDGYLKDTWLGKVGDALKGR